MRRSLIPAGALVAALAGSLVLAPGALANGKPHGDNGTVKIHDSKTGEEIKANQPKVCSFYLDAFGFDAGQKVDWHIEAWANNEKEKGETVKSGLITLDADGHERTEDMTLPNGQYKLFWNFEGENGKAKHKVFKTDCPPGEEPTKPGEEPTKPGEEPTKPGEEPTKPGEEPTKPGETPGSTASPTPGAPGSTGGTDTKGDSEGNLAETGSSAPVGIIGAVAVALAGVGGLLVMRRRKAQQH
ncbi:LPXTG cell wall anchor domain-containing protein [Streptomyces sp. ms191]|uniref:LPXTG cell wall anchor domain-containing protein n=1 Tax=unclassified Streptomyces TaxID=2593676 RepID=UPI0011CE8175|nr:LPXTG cell wall anchor domain-containing protein [Streptomyces sp. ms191]TXS30058.1 LPXTG cell wall anchor domain-containing protein [Streptomyces sp. ms191]